MISIPSFAKINLGLKIGPAGPDGFHELRTVYQTIALHDVVHVAAQPGEGIEIRCKNPRVPSDKSNTCWKIAEQVLAWLALNESQKQVPRLTLGRSTPSRSARDDNPKSSRSVVVDIEKRLPVQGGLGAASSNAVAAMLALERVLGINIAGEDKLRMAAEVGSDLPLFLIGGTVFGMGRGEEVYPLPDLPPLNLVVVTPAVGISTPWAFARWDELRAEAAAQNSAELTGLRFTRTINKSSALDWLAENIPQAERGPATGVPAAGGNRAETPLLDLVRTGIENDFERVVFPEHPELREVKELLVREGAEWASLSGSGSTLYGVFASAEQGQAAAKRLSAAGHAAVATTTLTRDEYWTAVARG